MRTCFSSKIATTVFLRIIQHALPAHISVSQTQFLGRAVFYLHCMFQGATTVAFKELKFCSTF